MAHRKNIKQNAIKRSDIHTKQDNGNNVRRVDLVPTQTQNEEVKEAQAPIKQQEEKKEVVIEVPKVEINHSKKIKKTMSLSVKNDSDLEALSDRTGIAKSKIVDILLSKFLKLEINDEFDIYDINISK
jgi:flagellar basal body-associated protein FliL